MTEGIIGKKIGMTRVFRDDGRAEAITAIEAGPCTVVQIKTEATDGYNAAKLGFGEIGGRKTGRGSKEKIALRYRYMREFRTESAQAVSAGQKIDVGIFKAGDIIDVIGTSKGKGFAGTVKRHHFSGGPKTHGQSDRHRAPGSVGSGTSPGRVYKGLRMAGHMGNERVTVRNLQVFQADPARNLLLVRGAVPGGRNSLLLIRKSGGK